MPDPRHLARAPIVEAIIDFRVQPPGALDPQRLSSVHTAIRDRFPEIKERRRTKLKFEVPSRPPSLEDLGLDGFLFKSADGKQIAQLRTNGFTLNRLGPYTSWQELAPLAQELWRLYCEAASPEVVIRLGARYINRIPLPADLTEFNEYLRSPPAIPPELPHEISAFFYRTTIHDSSTDVSAHVAQVLDTAAAADTPVVILDIDAFREVDLEPEDDELFNVLDRLREFKNLIFFNMLTEKALGLFE
jgi:uncharacterized protein (TIGR04255 family)